MSSVNRASRIRGMPPFSSRYLRVKLNDSQNRPLRCCKSRRARNQGRRTYPTIVCASSVSRRMRLASAAALARAPRPGSHTFEPLNRQHMRAAQYLSFASRCEEGNTVSASSTSMSAARRTRGLGEGQSTAASKRVSFCPRSFAVRRGVRVRAGPFFTARCYCTPWRLTSGTRLMDDFSAWRSLVRRLACWLLFSDLPELLHPMPSS